MEAFNSTSHDLLTIDTPYFPAKNTFENDVCFSRLLQIFQQYSKYQLFKWFPI